MTQSSNYKVAIITGASKGIGRSTAIKFLNNLKCTLVSRKINNEFKKFLKKNNSKNFASLMLIFLNINQYQK